MPEATNISATPFDGAEAWATLDPALQALIGAAALELAVARAIGEHAGADPAERAGWEAERLALDALQDAALGLDGMRDPLWIDGSVTAEAYRLPSVLGQVCHACGCSHHDPCDGGCGWAADDLCTACAEPEAAAPPPLDLSHVQARAVVRGACQALGDSDVRGLPPVGRALGNLARALETMHEEGGDAP